MQPNIATAIFIGYVIVTTLAAAANAYGAIIDFLRSEWVLGNMTKYGVPHSWLASLGALKGLGALGLLIGIAAPPIGIAAAIGMVIYFICATVVVMRAGWYSHVRYPATFLLLAAGSLAFRLASW
jgi:hypothetical protein